MLVREKDMDFIKSIDNGEFEVWYQPQINMLNEKICGAEALVRWKEKNGNLISPSEFIPDFEKDGRIIELDHLVLCRVCEDIRSARKENRKFGPISVNLSKRNAERKDTEKKIHDIIARYGIGTSDLLFEITESASDLSDGDQTELLVRRLRELGFLISMDDYGTGSSTLKSLADISFDRLKIDRSFISCIGNRRTDIILKSTIHMAKQLRAGIVAEGVETEKQVKFLKENGCYIAQGYYYYKPLPKEEYLCTCSCCLDNENRGEEV